MARPGVTSTLISATRQDQLESNIAATEISLSAAQMRRLDDASKLASNFSASLVTPEIRRMIFGGRDVAGWGE